MLQHKKAWCTLKLRIKCSVTAPVRRIIRDVTTTKASTIDASKGRLRY